MTRTPIAARRRRVALPPPDLDVSFRAGLPVGWTLVRESTAMRQVGSVWSSVPAGEPVIEPNGLALRPAGRQHLRNSAGLGSSPMAVPAGWSGFDTSSGVTIAVAGRGVEDGLPYVDVSITGTSTGTASNTIFFGAATAECPATVGTTVVTSVFLREVSGDASAIAVSLAHQERTSAGAAVGSTEHGAPIPIDATMRRSAYTYAMSEATAASDQPGLYIVIETGVTVATTIRVAAPNWSLGSIPGDPSIVALDTVALTGTEQIRNVTFAGAGVGTPGTAPTNWTVPSTGSGLTREIVSVGADHIDLHYSGIATATASLAIYLETTTQIVAAPGNVIGVRALFGLVAGSPAGTTFQLAISENNAVGVAQATQIGPSLPITGTLAPFSSSFVVGHANAARARPYLRFAVTSGAAIDFTLRLAFDGRVCTLDPTSTTYTAVIPRGLRRGDVLSAVGAWFGDSSGSICLDIAAGDGTAATTLLSMLSGGNGWVVHSATGRGLAIDVMASGAVVATATLTQEYVMQGVASRLSVSWGGWGLRARWNLEEALALATVPALSSGALITIGSDTAGAGQPGAWVTRLRSWTSALTQRQANRASEPDRDRHALLILGNGQSLSVGSWGFDVESSGTLPAAYTHPDPSGRVLMFRSPPTVHTGRSDVRLGSARYNGQWLPASDQEITADEIIGWEQCIARQATTGSSGLTPAESLARAIQPDVTNRYGPETLIVVAVVGVGGASIRSLLEVPSAIFPNGHRPYGDALVMLTRFGSICRAHGYLPRVLVYLKHGEADGGLPSYGELTAQLLAGFWTDAEAILGPGCRVMTVDDQHSTFEDHKTYSVAADRDLHAARITTIAGPNYPFREVGGYRWDHQHMIAKGYIWTGQIAARAVRPTLSSRPRWDPLEPSTINRSGVVIDITHHVPTPPLRWSPIVSDPGQRGYRVWTAAGIEVPISSVEIVGDDVVRLVCASDPGVGYVVDCGWRGYVTPAAASSPAAYVGAEMPRSCLCDSEGEVGWEGIVIPNHSIHWSMAGD